MTGTIWQANAEAFAQRPAAAMDQQRHVGVRTVLGFLREGRPGRARYELARSVERQARIAGLGTWPIQPVCPCGGRCSHGGAA